MKATGIVRRIDELGRVVLPIELRRTLRINEGDSLEILCSDEGILLRKYGLLSSDKSFCSSAANALHDALGHAVAVFDSTGINAVCGIDASLIGTQLAPELYQRLASRRTSVLEEPVLLGTKEFQRCILSPLAVHGDLYGGVLVLNADETLIPVLQACTVFLSGYLN